ncbi:hypothetical protein D3C71_907560 [compost metagenome]
MDYYLTGIIFLLLSVLVSRMLDARANKKLTADKKVALIDLFSKDRIYTSVVLILIVVLFLLNFKFKLIDPMASSVLYIFVLATYVVVVSFLTYRKLKENDFPGFYIKSYILTTSLRTLALLIFLLGTV